MEEWTHEDMQELGQSFCLYTLYWYLGLLGPVSSHALDIMEGKITFPLVWFVIPGTREVDDHVVSY